MSTETNDLSLYDRVLRTLVLSAQAEMVAEGQDHAVLSIKNGASFILTIRYHPDERAMVAFARELSGQLRETGGELVLVGGPAAAWKTVSEFRPTGMSTRAVHLHHVDETGQVQHSKRSFSMGVGRLSVLETLRPGTEAEEEQYQELLQIHAAKHGDDLDELNRFTTVMAQRKPIATWLLILTCVAVYIMQRSFADPNLAAGYLRMGALQSTVFADGEWWRLLSCTLLHGSIEHLLFNMVVLYSLGSFLERLIGTSRFLLLYGAAAIVGSVVSATFLEPGRFSVGASGALWGILGADAVLAYVRHDLLPGAIVARARSAASFNLVINILASFQPNIDAAAHFGGGAMGAVLLFTGVLTNGFSRGTQSQNDAPPAPAWVNASAGVIVIALVGCLGIAMQQGKPWTLNDPLSMKRMNFPKLSTTIEIPEGRKIRFHPVKPGVTSVIIGDPQTDGGVIEVAFFKLPKVVPPEQAIKEIKQVLTSSPPAKNAKIKGVPTVHSKDGVRIGEAHYTDADQIQYKRLMRTEGDGLWRIDVIYHGARKSLYKDIGRRMIYTAGRLK